MRLVLATVLLAASAATAVSSDAFAQGRHHHYHALPASEQLSSMPLTVNRRSWLDPGTAVSQGSQQAYMSASTQFATTQDRIVGPDRYGNDVMQGQPYVPGRSVHLVEFSSLPNGDAELDNVIGAQNYYFNPAPALPAPAPALVRNSDDTLDIR